MLLLVLILVLIAFGLLVVALLTGNVLSAWLSVAVSVAAAVVLIIDWLQRRSAIKAGRAGSDSASNPSPESPPADLDPVTEVLPVYTPDADDEDTAEKRFGRPAEGQRTVVIPAVQPSGSAARPSGAEGTSTPSGGFSSLRVTRTGSEASPVEDSGTRPDDDDGRTDGRSDAEATVAVDIRKAGIGGSSADTDAPGGTAVPASSAGTSRSDADAVNRADRGSAAEPHARDGGDAPATDRQAEPAPTGSQAGSAVAGAAGLAGAAIAGGLAAAKDRPDDRTTADTQVVNIGKSGDSGGPAADATPDERSPDERRPAGASFAGGDTGQADEATSTSEDRWVGAPPTAAGSPIDGDRPGSGRAMDPGAAEARDVGDSGIGAVGSRPASDPAEREPADDRAGGDVTGSRPDADPGAGTRAAGRGTGSGEGERSSTAWSEKTADDAPAAQGRPGAWAANAEPPTGERRGGDTWASGAATGDIRPANAWATGAAATSSAPASNAPASDAPSSNAAGTAERRPSDARGAEPGDHPNGTSAGATSRPGADEGGRPDASSTAPETSAAEPPARDDQAARTTFGGSGSGSGHDLFEPSRGGGQQVPAQQTGSAYEDDAEPPEESTDSALGRVAATVEDEVLVIDEQPRYHLMGCRALMAQQTIPLPAREAVELGFTPCGWCNPVAALGARHPASAR